MIEVGHKPEREQIKFISLAPFLIISFGLAWGILALYIFFQDYMSAIFGPISGDHPLFFLAVYAPAIAAFFLILKNAGLSGLSRFLSRIFLWRCSLRWYGFLFIVIPLIFYAGSAWKGNLMTESFPYRTIISLLIAVIFALIKGPVEEFGWRGFVLPLLQQKFSPFWAGLILGIIWGLWHFPAFQLSGTQQSAWSFAPFFLGTITISLIMTVLFNAAHGSILLPVLMHFQLMNPIWPDAQPYDTYLLLFAAILIIWFNRKKVFGRETAVINVIPPEKSDHY